MPSKTISEDSADITIREYLSNEKKWDVAFYSPPCGSWSTIKLDLDGYQYETFSPRDIKRPDMILYKVENNKLRIIAIESKDAVNKFNANVISDYIKQMNKYANSIIKEKYRLVKNKSTGDFTENKNIPQKYIDGYEVHLGFLACSENLSADLNLLKEMLPVDNNVFGILVEVDWINLVCKIQSISDSTGNFNKNQVINFSY